MTQSSLLEMAEEKGREYAANYAVSGASDAVLDAIRVAHKNGILAGARAMGERIGMWCEAGSEYRADLAKNAVNGGRVSRVSLHLECSLELDSMSKRIKAELAAMEGK